MDKFTDLTGNIFGKLTVIRRAENDKWGKTRWLCLCECGNEKIIRRSGLVSGNTNSCGCLHREITSERNYKHGCSAKGKESAEYMSWKHMLSRCTNSNNKDYKHYGGRGITVCKRWRDSFENFLNDMGQKPSPQHSIERIDNSKGYFPNNCEWATPVEQAINRRIGSANKTGVKGVCWHKRIKKLQARIKINGKNIHLGYFDTIEEAAEARKKAEEQYWGLSI